MHSTGSIIAISTSVLPSARLIVRISGDNAHGLATRLTTQPLPSPGRPLRQSLAIDDLRIPAWVYRFDAPRSYTGEHLVEFHLPGSALIGKLVTDALLAAGARPAQPGEFTARAYFNGRLDLTEAEAVATLVAARNEEELRAARQLMAGELARRLAPAMDALANALALMEVGIDFSDEDVTFITAADLGTRIDDVSSQLGNLLAQSARFERLSHEPRIVLTGRPNAGKSTLINALSGAERAVVSDMAGTTRDVLSATAALPSGLVELQDAAGLEESTDARNEIDRAMHDQALRAIREADVVVLLIPADDDRPPLPLERVPDLVIRTKGDLAPVSGALNVSARTGIGMAGLKAALDRLAFGQRESGTTLALNARHVRAIESARASLENARLHLPVEPVPIELIALDLREALDALGSILGVITPDDVLGRIFSRFCIGK